MKRELPLRKYEKNDRDIVDYAYQLLDGCSFAVRGPLLGRERKRGEKAIACLGSAATFGRRVLQPYSALLQEQIGGAVINLGFGGARPETYLREQPILQLCRNMDVIVLELMSARSYASEFFIPCDHLGRQGRVTDSYIRKMDPRKAAAFRDQDVAVDRAYEWAANMLPWQTLQRIREQVLAAYLRDARALIQTIGRPVVLLWFSRRSIDAAAKPGAYASWHCGFPHFLDRQTVNQLKEDCLGLVDITSADLGPEAPAESNGRSGGEIDWGRGYYPSAEMHVEVARHLAAFLSAQLAW